MKLPARLAIALILLVASLAASAAEQAPACKEPVSPCIKPIKGSLALIIMGQPATLLIEPAANSAVKLASANFAADLERVAGKLPRRSPISAPRRATSSSPASWARAPPSMNWRAPGR